MVTGLKLQIERRRYGDFSRVIHRKQTTWTYECNDSVVAEPSFLWSIHTSNSHIFNFDSMGWIKADDDKKVTLKIRVMDPDSFFLHDDYFAITFFYFFVVKTANCNSSFGMASEF